MPTTPIDLDLPSPDATARFARALGAGLEPGDTVLLQGGLGAGKTHLARHLIQSILQTPEDVPSPTFTLIQIYDTRRGPLWHADLYRLGATSEVEETGLLDAFETEICLVEWPERLGDTRPPEALDLALVPDEQDPDARHMRLTWTDPKWTNRLDWLD